MPMMASPPMILEHAAFKLRELLLYLKAHRLEDEIRDTRDLPVPKSTLINALRLLIAAETRTEQRQQMQRVGIQLAQFQPLATLASAVSNDALDDPLTRWIATVAEQTKGDIEHDRWATVLAERDRLETLFKVSARMAERRLDPCLPRISDVEGPPDHRGQDWS